MKKHIRKIAIILGVIIGGLLVVAGILAIWFYKTPSSSLKDKIGRVLPLPAVFVSGQPIFMSSFLERVNSAQAIYGSVVNMDQNTIREQVLNQMIEEKKTGIIANKFGVPVSAKELNDQFNSIKDQASQQSVSGLATLLGKYNLTENQFKNEVLKPELEYTDLMLWFNSQRTLNPKEYLLADSIRSQVLSANSSTGTFASLVQQYSQDTNSKVLDGDMGFVEITGLLPEFRQSLDSAKVGDVVIAPSRYGLHIFKIEFKDNNGKNNASRIQIKQVFLRTEDFNKWYQDETKNIPIKKLI
jgi:parvulin-like peptidyl-prolyl isomerase